MASQSWWKLAVEIVLPLLALLLFAAWQSGGLEEIKKVALGAKEYLPDVSVGLDELSAERVALPVEVQKEVTSLKETLQKMAQSNKINCFAKFNGFRSDLGNDDASVSITLAYDSSQDLTRVNVNKEKSLRSDVLFEVKGMKPCVVAGKDAVLESRRNIAENFFDYFIGGKPQFDPYYKRVQRIEIYYSDRWDEWGGNIIRVPEFGEAYVNDEGNNFQSNGYLFKGREGEICFFPTNKERDADEDGIAEEWFTVAEQNSILNRLARNEERTQWCFEETTGAEATIPAGKVIFVPVNWGGAGLSDIMSTQFDYYTAFYGVNKEPIYLEESPCLIPELEPPARPGAEKQIQSCDELFKSKDSGALSEKDIANTKLIECAKKMVPDFSNSLDMVVGVVNQDVLGGAEGYTLDGIIFLYSNSDVMTLAHEAGHRDFGYCDEYQYGKEEVQKGILECYEETNLSLPEYAEINYRAIPSKAHPQLEWSGDIPRITFSVAEGLGEINIYFIKEGTRITQVWDKSIKTGWLLSNTLRGGCPNKYPSCCIDSPKWIGYTPNINPYGANCYPNGLPLPVSISPVDKEYPERFDVLSQLLCIGGPCANSESPHCRSIMGPAGITIPRGLPK